MEALWRGERKCIDPKAGDADLWIEIWEELHSLAARDIEVEVEHVKAHCTKKDKKEWSHFEKFVTDGNETADDLAKAGAVLDEGFMAETRAKTVQQEREKKCMQPCSMRPASTVWWRNGRIVKDSSRSQKERWIFVDKKRENTTGPQYLLKLLANGESDTWEDTML